jgi:hypothetical protein
MYKRILIFAAAVVFLSSCTKKDDVTYSANVAELDVASYNGNFGTLSYPFVTRQPLPGRAILSADAFITRASGTATFRVNLIGAQRSTPINVKYQTFVVGPAVGTSVTYGSPVSATLATIDAAAGTHYTALSGVCTIPANSSFGTITIPILNSGTSASTTALLGIELLDGSDIPVSANYKKVAFAISQK